MIEMVKATFINLLLLLLIPLIVVLVLTFINRNSKELLIQRFGIKALIWVGGIGVIVHELSHLLMALMFGHHINRCRLLITDIQDSGGVLGYVNHSWNKNSYYQSLGNVLIGTAPTYGCTAVLILLTRWLAPGVYRWGLRAMGSFYHLPLDMSVPTNTNQPILLLIWALLSISITIGGFDLSNADLKSTIPAFLTLYVLVALVLFVLICCGFASQIAIKIRVILSCFILVMLISMIWSLIVNLLCRLINL